jgi:hypothetical protein
MVGREAGRRDGRCRESGTPPLALLTLSIEVQEMVRRGALPPSHAYEIAKAPPENQLIIARDVVSDRMRLDETIDMVTDYRIDAGDLPKFKRKPWRFPFPGGRAVHAAGGHPGRHVRYARRSAAHFAKSRHVFMSCHPVMGVPDMI